MEYVVSLEQEPENLSFITPWERTQHEAAIRFPDFRHFIIEGGEFVRAVLSKPGVACVAHYFEQPAPSISSAETSEEPERPQICFLNNILSIARVSRKPPCQVIRCGKVREDAFLE